MAPRVRAFEVTSWELVRGFCEPGAKSEVPEVVGHGVPVGEEGAVLLEEFASDGKMLGVRSDQIHEGMKAAEA